MYIIAMFVLLRDFFVCHFTFLFFVFVLIIIIIVTIFVIILKFLNIFFVCYYKNSEERDLREFSQGRAGPGPNYHK